MMCKYLRKCGSHVSCCGEAGGGGRLTRKSDPSLLMLIGSPPITHSLCSPTAFLSKQRGIVNCPHSLLGGRAPIAPPWLGSQYLNHSPFSISNGSRLSYPHVWSQFFPHPVPSPALFSYMNPLWLSPTLACIFFCTSPRLEQTS